MTSKTTKDEPASFGNVQSVGAFHDADAKLKDFLRRALI
jgi:hypothetical protein